MNSITNQSIQLNTEIILNNKDLFWKLAQTFILSNLLNEYDNLLALKIPETIIPIKKDDDGILNIEDIIFCAGELFKSDDYVRLVKLTEKMNKEIHQEYFDRLKYFSKIFNQSTKCISYLRSIDVFETPATKYYKLLTNDNITISDINLNNNDFIDLLTQFDFSESQFNTLFLHFNDFFNFSSLLILLNKIKKENNLHLFYLKLKQKYSNEYLQAPEDDIEVNSRILEKLISLGFSKTAIEILKIDNDLAYAPILIKASIPPWNNDNNPLKLEGALSLTITEWACIFNQDDLAKYLSKFGAQSPSISKISILLPALSKICDSRNSGAGKNWLIRAESKCMSIAKLYWAN